MIRGMKAARLILCCCLVFSGALGQTERSANKRAVPATQSCLFDYERGEVPNCVYIAGDGSRSIARHYLKDLTYESNGLASVRGMDGWMYGIAEERFLSVGCPHSTMVQISSATVW